MGEGKQNAEKAVFDYAARLLQVHASARRRAGLRSDRQQMAERIRGSFFSRKRRINSRRSTRRRRTWNPNADGSLICGDVGFGKTEVAIRAAFKAVMGGKQVAILAPTTVLAQQHYQTFRERMSDYP
jgi:transcription-repair coupling factor (superfamily II helicase)